MSQSALDSNRGNNNRRACVVIALSGGVDSSVAAALLVNQGYQVIGMMMRLWSEPGQAAVNRCCTPEAMAQAKRVSAILDIPFYAIDAQEYFHNTVVNYFLNGYVQGSTPNPCLICNRKVRWEFLLNHALSFGADYMATGHYARVERRDGDRTKLLRGSDGHKDQSYVLHILNQDQLSRAIFPLGEYTKAQVRQLARDFGLPVAERPESQDLCFLGGKNYRNFLERHAPGSLRSGPILNQKNEILGTHLGLPFYTIGQRKALGVASHVPLYVLEKDLERNAIIVGKQADLGQSELLVEQLNWVSIEPPARPVRAQIKIRYKALESPAIIIPQDHGKARVIFDDPVRDITPGQAAVFYDREVCLGGGIIESSAKTTHF